MVKYKDSAVEETPDTVMEESGLENESATDNDGESGDEALVTLTPTLVQDVSPTDYDGVRDDRY